MASSKHTQRAVLAGLSCGVGLAAPVLAYTVTLPFAPANDVVASGALPFALGAVAGVGFYAASMGIADRRAEDRAQQAEQSRIFGGAQPTTQFQMNERFRQRAAQQADSYRQNVAAQDDREWDRPVEVLDDRLDTGRIPQVRQQGASRAQAPFQSQPQSPWDAAAQPASQPYSGAAGDTNPLGQQTTGSLLSGLSGVFQRRHSLDDVPTITRAVGAPSEDEAWAMIDSMLDEDSPVSCDPARSRDVYEVAIDEMRDAAAETGSINRDDIAAAARAVAGSRVAPAGTTAQFVSMVANANAAAAGAAQPQNPAWGQAGSGMAGDGFSGSADDAENAAAREAAVNSLWGTPERASVNTGKPAVPYNDALASLPVISANGNAVSADDTFVATMAANVPQTADQQAAYAQESATFASGSSANDTFASASQSFAASEKPVQTVSNGPVSVDVDDEPVEEDVPMADYSGHEDMWAAALAVLDEPAEETAPAASVVAKAPSIDSDPAYVGTHSRVFPEDTARMSRRGIERAEAIAEGVLANRRHARVNEILEEEIDRIDSKSVRRTGHDYLSVIEGGTSPFSPLQAEA